MPTSAHNQVVTNLNLGSHTESQHASRSTPHLRATSAAADAIGRNLLRRSNLAQRASQRQTAFEESAEQMMLELNAVNTRLRSLNSKISSFTSSTDLDKLIFTIETLRKDSQILYEKLKQLALLRHPRFNAGVLPSLSKSIEEQLNQELIFKKAKRYQEVEDSLSLGSRFLLLNPKYSLVIPFTESTEFLDELAKEKIKNLEEQENFGGVKRFETYLETIDSSIMAFCRVVSFIKSKTPDSVAFQSEDPNNIVNSEIIQELDSKLNLFNDFRNGVKEKALSYAPGLANHSGPLNTQKPEESVQLLIELMPINQFIEELSVSAIAYLVEKGQSPWSELLGLLNDLAFYSGRINKLLIHLCKFKGWEHLLKDNPRGQLILDKAFEVGDSSDSIQSDPSSHIHNRYWYRRLFDYVSDFLTGFYSSPSAEQIQQSDCAIAAKPGALDLTDIKGGDSSDESPPNSPQGLSPQSLIPHINHRTTRLTGKAQKLLQTRVIDLIENCKKRPGYYSPDTVFRMYQHFAPKARDWCEAARSLKPQLEKELERDGLPVRVKQQLLEMVRELDIREKMLQSELDYSESEAFRFGTLKGFSTPREHHWQTLIDSDQVERIELVGKLPTENDQDNLYEFKFTPKQDPDTDYKPVWMHVHVWSPVKSNKHWLDLKSSDVKAAHLKSDAMRPLGAQWQAAERNQGRYDAVVERSAVSLDFVKTAASKADGLGASASHKSGKSKAAKRR